MSSFFSFAVGAALPVLPYLLGADTLWPALVISLLALFALRSASSLASRRGRGGTAGIRQMLLGGLAAALTYFIGDLVGASLG